MGTVFPAFPIRQKESALSLEHSFYAVYGVELADADWLVVGEALEGRRRARGEETGGVAGEDVQLFTVAGGDGPDRVVIGVAYEELAPGSCRAIGDFMPSPERDQVLGAAAAALGYGALAGPGWLMLHDWS
ncbi:hypothetical protein ABZ851_29925 [Streptomyces sp. NPDC047049]|uniref:hypothetical protein n=1 Tax=Streptomyces sp. NPDC047049 TaxID=3156688 RepID=UPI0034055149